MKHPLFPGPTPPKRMALSDPTVYRVEITDIESVDGKFVGLIVAPSGRPMGVMTVPQEYVISAIERAS